MKTTSEQKIKIGGFVLAGLAILIAGIFLIGNKKGLFTRTFTVYGMFKNVNGLQIGNNARFAGINVGVVQDIQITNDTTVKVILTLNEDVRKFVKRDAKLSISSDGLMGDKLVMITPGGTSNSQGVVSGDKLTGVNPFDVDRLVNKFSKITDDAGKLVNGLSEIVYKVNHGQGSIGRLLNNDKMARDLEGTVKQAKTTIAKVHKTTGTLNEDLKAAQSNFLLRGFFKKKRKQEKARQDSIKKAQDQQKQNDQQKNNDQPKP